MKVLSTKIVNWSDVPFALDEVPFIRINEVALPVDTEISDNLIFTSQNAVRFFLDQFPADQCAGKSVFCVGDKTANMLMKNGLSPVMVATNGEVLAEQVSGILKKPTTFTFVCGNRRRNELPARLKEKGHELNELIIYKTELAPKKVEEKYNIILFFSPSGVESFLLANNLNEELCLCIGETTAEAFNEIHNKVRIIGNQTLESMKNLLLQEYYDHKERSVS